MASHGPSERLRSEEMIVKKVFLPRRVWPMLMRHINVTVLRIM